MDVNDTANATGQKSKVELQQEHKKAEESLDENVQKRPKNLQQGLMFGASNILKGTVGGLGVAIISPVIGCKAGAEKGGFVGGAVGLVGGAAIG